MIRKPVIVLLLLLISNLVLGQNTSLHSKFLSGFNKDCLKELSLEGSNYNHNFFDSSFNKRHLILEPVTANDILGEYASGFFIGNAGALIVGLITGEIMGLKIDLGGGGSSSSSFSFISLITLMASAQVFGSTGGVLGAGTNKNVGADYGTTLLGSIGGLALEVGGIFIAASLFDNDKSTLGYITGFVSISLPAVGAIIGLNSTRFPKRVYDKPKSLINLSKNNIHVNFPAFYYNNQEKTFLHRPISFVKVVSFNF